MANSNKIGGRNLSIRVFGPEAASAAISPDFKGVTIDYSADDQESTAYGDNTHVNLAGLRNYSIAVDGFWAGSGTTPSACLIATCLLAARDDGMIQVNPAGSTAGSLAYVACVNFQQVNMAFPVENICTLSFTCTPRAGSLSACAESIW